MMYRLLHIETRKLVNHLVPRKLFYGKLPSPSWPNKGAAPKAAAESGSEAPGTLSEPFWGCGCVWCLKLSKLWEWFECGIVDQCLSLSLAQLGQTVSPGVSFWQLAMPGRIHRRWRGGSRSCSPCHACTQGGACQGTRAGGCLRSLSSDFWIPAKHCTNHQKWLGMGRVNIRTIS